MLQVGYRVRYIKFMIMTHRMKIARFDRGRKVIAIICVDVTPVGMSEKHYFSRL